MNATVTPAPVMPRDRAVLAAGSLESAWITERAWGSRVGALGSVEQVPASGSAPAELRGPTPEGCDRGARWMIWSGTTRATAGFAARRARSPAETVAAMALMIV